MTTKVFFMYLFNILIITEMFMYWIFKIITKMLIIFIKTKIFILRIEICFQLNYLYFDMIWIFFGNFTRLLYFLYPKIIVILFFLIYLILIRTTYEKKKQIIILARISIYKLCIFSWFNQLSVEPTILFISFYRKKNAAKSFIHPWVVH